MSKMLYESLRKKILPLPDDLIVYPCHGKGCDTLGNLKKTHKQL